MSRYAPPVYVAFWTSSHAAVLARLCAPRAVPGGYPNLHALDRLSCASHWGRCSLSRIALAGQSLLGRCGMMGLRMGVSISPLAADLERSGLIRDVEVVHRP